MSENMDGNVRGEEETIVALLREIKAENEKQRKYMRKQLHFMQLTALSIIVLVVLAIGSIISILPRLNEVTVQAESIIENLEVVTSELATADIAGMMDNVDNLVISSEESMHEALGKINEMDIDSLNKSIQNFGAVIEPLAKFFGKR